MVVIGEEEEGEGCIQLSDKGKEQMGHIAKKIQEMGMSDVFIIFPDDACGAEAGCVLIDEIKRVGIRTKILSNFEGENNWYLLVGKHACFFQEFPSIIIITYLDLLRPVYGFWGAIKERWGDEPIVIRDIGTGITWEPMECFSPQRGAALIFDFETKTCLHLAAFESE